MDLFLLICYSLIAIIFATRVMFIALVSFVSMMLLFNLNVEPYMLHAIYVLCVFPLAFIRKDTLIKLAVFLFAVFQWRMIVDCSVNPDAKTELFFAYPYIAFVLHLLIILSLINKGLIDGINNTLFTRVNNFIGGLLNSKPNHSHNKTNTGRS